MSKKKAPACRAFFAPQIHGLRFPSSAAPPPNRPTLPRSCSRIVSSLPRVGVFRSTTCSSRPSCLSKRSTLHNALLLNRITSTFLSKISFFMKANLLVRVPT